jgi:pyruvate dehydrogenase (quinone)
VKRIYGIAGDSLNGITDVIRADERIKWIHVRREETAAFAAGAEAHLTGRLAVCAGSCGPGNLHLINGLYDANRSRVPVLVIASQITSYEIGSQYFQETHPESIFRECSHYCELISQAEQMPRLHFPPLNAMVRPFDEDIARVTAILNESRKLTILGGAGCAGAHAELIELAKKLKAPIVHALRGKEFIEYDNPFDVGMTGLLGLSSGYHAMMDCDTLLMLGTDFPYQQFYPEKATIIQVHIRGEQIGRRTKVDVGLIGDVKSTIRSLLPGLNEKMDDQHLSVSIQRYQKARTELDELAAGEADQKTIHPQYVAKVINELAAEDAIFTCDVGTPTIWASRYLSMNGKRRLLGSFSHGSMASALPQAIGAQLVYPDRQVIAMSGDGGLTMLMGDLLSLRQLGLPVKLIVFNNSALAFVELEMKAAGMLDFATDLCNPDFAKMAEAAGVLGLRADVPEHVRPILVQALSHPGPALVEVVVDRQELALPPSVKLDQIKGFSLFMMKAVINGRGSEVIDLLKTNLF